MGSRVSLLYALVRILKENKPKRIIEFGLGESSKLISAFLLNDQLPGTEHVVLEQDKVWISIFKDRYSLGEQTHIEYLPLTTRQVQGNAVNSYEGIEEFVKSAFNLYVIDGPHGSARYSRFDIVRIAEHLTNGDDFIVIVDDTNRIGELETVGELKKVLASKSIKYVENEFRGKKHFTMLCSEGNRFFTTI